MLKIQNIRLPLDYRPADLQRACERALGRKELPKIRILRRSIDARRTEAYKEIHYHISAGVLGFSEGEERQILKKCRNKNVMLTNEKEYHFPFSRTDFEKPSPEIREISRDGKETSDVEMAPGGKRNLRPVIIGTGPAGYFAGLMLARAGFRPILLERGKPVEERKQDVDRFWAGGKLDPESNVSFGEGGAGTFSDGKLFTGNKDRDGAQAFVLKAFHQFGAGEEITYDAKPHIGTDVLFKVMQNMRKEIEEEGGEIRFAHMLAGISPQGDAGHGAENDRPIYRLTVKKLEEPAASYSLETSAVIMAIGHSARDTFSMLKDFGLSMEKKPFAVGLRIEHPREMIDRARYGADEKIDRSCHGEEEIIDRPGHDTKDTSDKAGTDLYRLPAADYKLTYHTSEGRAVFSFCMCPGGYVVNASTEEGGVVVNGMSYSGRSGSNSNSAIVVNILPEDIPGDEPLDAVNFQRALEQAMYRAGKGNIPVQCYGDFVQDQPTEALGEILPQIKGKYTLSNLREGLPDILSRAIIEALPAFGREIPGFDRRDAVLSGIESRTSSPVRILRDEKLQAVHFPGIFPCGEGAGYAGGITSAAVDGIHVAEAAAGYLTGTEG